MLRKLDAHAGAHAPSAIAREVSEITRHSREQAPHVPGDRGAPGRAQHLITSFFRPPLRKPRTSLHPPILRPEILAAARSEGEHVLVYQSADGESSLLDTLAHTGLECRVYGVRRGIDSEQVEGNLRHRPFSEQGFIADLASARAVIAGGGFTLMGEAVYLHKPMLAVPIRGQFEQVLNARYLERLGYGRYAQSLDDADAVLSFLSDVPRCQERLASYQQDGNRELLRALDRALSGELREDDE